MLMRVYEGVQHEPGIKKGCLLFIVPYDNDAFSEASSWRFATDPHYGHAFISHLEPESVPTHLHILALAAAILDVVTFPIQIFLAPAALASP